MRSIKKGRGPSFMGGVFGIFMILFGVVWTIIAASMGGGLFALFGVFFVGMAIVTTVYNFKNATGKNRYSEYDITEGNEEPDPWNQRYGADNYNSDETNSTNVTNRYCPYCGVSVADDFEYCNNCGKRLP